MGSVYLKDGYFYGSYRNGLGKREQVRLRARNKTEARALVAELELKAERQRLGLEARPTDDKQLVWDLCDWWLKNICPPASRDAERSRLTLYVFNTPLARVPLRSMTTAVLQEHVDSLQRVRKTATKTVLSPGAINLLRRVLNSIFNAAIKRGRWVGANPVTGVEKLPVPKRRYETLTEQEVPKVLAAATPVWRPLMTTAIFTGMRKGELLGLKKEDVDLKAGTILVTRSHDRDTTKGKHADLIPIAAPLLPILETAIKESKSEYVFPAANGKPHHRHTDLAVVLRRTLSRAGLVKGYRFTCRRCKAAGRPHEEQHQDQQERRCPVCRARLWVSAIPRAIRFHDLRHTAATLMFRAGVDAHRVQRVMRHKDIRTTTSTYAHLDVEDLRDAVDRIAPEDEAP